MKNIKRHLVVSAFVAITATAGAAKANEELFTPTSVGCFDSGECFIALSTTVSSTSTSCANRSQVRFKMANNPGADAMYKTALSAYLSGKKLWINFPGTTSCISNFPQAWYLYITN
jgi:hypothetical protein